ncbi:uncharacterized protein PG986_012498 [Apiospora aurea]|uniref:Uncharacterized protein n=1 Tax=Apiospora aurea TaxID=335848 RepID=A0ABR1Q0E8_9PEZI
MDPMSSANLLGARTPPDNAESPRHGVPPPGMSHSTGSAMKLEMSPIDPGSHAGGESVEIARDENHADKQEPRPPTATVPAASRRWETGVMTNLPWTFIIALLGTITWFGGCIGVVSAADRTKTSSWAVSPTVILAILGPLGSMMLQYALSCGLAITWWHSALNGTTLGTLHRQWDHGTSAWAAVTSRTHMDKIAIAKLVVLSVFAVNPLLQRALTTNLSTEREDVVVSTAAATDVKSLQSMNFTDASIDGFFNPVQLSPQMAWIKQQFTERAPISGAISGCTGNCSGTLTAAGIDAQCNTVRNTSFIANYGKGAGGETPVFKTGTNIMNSRTGAFFNLTIFYAETNIDQDDNYSAYEEMKSCRGMSTTVTCVLQHAIVAYPFAQKDGVIVPETQPARIRVLSTEPALVSGHQPSAPDHEPIFGGLSIAADSILNSTGTVHTMGKYGWGFRTSGPLTATYLVRGGDKQTCAVAFDDPTDHVLAKLHEIMFRVAVAAPNASSPRAEFVAQQQTVAIIYESRYIYLWGAMAITMLAIAAVGWTAAGFQSLGRPVSLSPLEIANAFGPPLLRDPGTSNMTIDELMGAYHGTGVQYMTTEVDHAGDRKGGTEDMDIEASASGKRLQMCFPGHGTRPQAQDLFTG